MQSKKRDIVEETFNSITHGLGSIMAILGLIYLYTMHNKPVALVVGVIVFLSCMLTTYSMSTLSHSLSFTKAKKIFAILDHSAIFLLIAGTYTPFLLAANTLSSILWLIGIWLLAAAGISLKAVFFGKNKKLSLISYLLFGWISIFALAALRSILTPWIVILLVLGGIMYTLGAIFYLAKRMQFSHMVWHIFVLFGSILHGVAIYLLLQTIRVN